MKKERVVTVRITDEMYDALLELSGNGTKVSSTARLMIESGLLKLGYMMKDGEFTRMRMILEGGQNGTM